MSGHDRTRARSGRRTAAAVAVLAMTMGGLACGGGDAGNGAGSGGALDGAAPTPSPPGSNGPASHDAGATDASSTPDGAPPAATLTITLRTLGTSQYVSANGDAIAATAASAGANESFVLTDMNGGALDDGDPVWIAAPNGHALSAVNGGGDALSTKAGSPGDDETFVLTRLAGPGIIASGDAIALKAKLKANYVSAINGGGGDVRVDAPWARGWETFTLTIANGSPPPAPGATSPRQQVLDFIASISGQKTIAGQHNKFNSTPAVSTDWIETNTGKTPGLWSADFGFGQDALSNRGKMIAEAKNQWAHGAIVQIMYHNCIPTGDELCDWDAIGGANPQHLSDSQWTDLVTDGTALNSAWKARLDALAVFFADLKSAGVAPLFRPLHEMNQGVFWWGGRSGAQGTLKLFQITHDYLVKTKGFDNIIWVWDIQDFGSLANDVNSYDPGAAYYDIAALDVYDGGYDQSKYDAMVGVAGAKPIAIGECEHPPTSADLAMQPKWAFFMVWPDFLDENAGIFPALYNASNVITEAQMPGWK